MAKKPGVAKMLSAKLGLSSKLGKPSRGAALMNRHAAPLPMPGSHAALLQRLYGK